MPDYLIKDIPVDTMKDFKTACAYLKRTMREDLLASMVVTIHHYKAKTGQLLAQYDRTKKKGAKR